MYPKYMLLIGMMYIRASSNFRGYLVMYISSRKAIDKPGGSGKGRNSLEAYQEQNAQLLEQNRKLTDTVTELKNLQTQRDQASHRNKLLIITAIILLVGFILWVSDCCVTGCVDVREDTNCLKG